MAKIDYKTAVIAFVSLPIFCAGDLVTAAEIASQAEWIYVVKTEPSEPDLEAEFNQWYDEIDIPDVLAVPSFRRARRAVAQSIPQFPDSRLKEDDGSYVALYDIATREIDKSIIDLYVAARKMNALDRSTQALRVVEANYYHRIGGMQLRRPDSGADRYFLIQKIVCCQTELEFARYKDWFSDSLVSQLTSDSGVVDANLYVLYRVMEELAVGDDEIPHLLAVFSLETSSITQTLTEIDEAQGGLRVSGGPGMDHEVRDSILYRQILDVRSD